MRYLGGVPTTVRMIRATGCNCKTGTPFLNVAGNCDCCPTNGKVINNTCLPRQRKLINGEVPQFIRINTSSLPIQVNNVNPCGRHQAPSGFKYVLVNGQCVLANLSGEIVPLQQPTATVPNVAAGIADTVKSFYTNNKTLVWIGLAGLGYYYSKKH